MGNETKVTENEIQSTGWTPFLGTMPTSPSTTDGVDTLTLADADDFLAKGAKLKITSTAGTHMYYVTDADSSEFDVVGETSVTGTITAMWYSYADCPFEFKKGEDWYKARGYRTSDRTLTSGVDDITNYLGETYDPNGDFDTSTNYCYIAPISGYYDVNVLSQFAITNFRNSLLRIKVNSVDKAYGGRVSTAATGHLTGNFNFSVQSVEWVNRGEKIQSSCTVSSFSGTQTLTAGEASTFMTIQFTGI